MDDNRHPRRVWTMAVVIATLWAVTLLAMFGYERHQASKMKVWQDAQTIHEQATLDTISRLQSILAAWTQQYDGQEPNVEQTRELLGLAEPLTFDPAGDAWYTDPTNGVTVRLWFRDQTFWTGVLRSTKPVAVRHDGDEPRAIGK